MSKFIEAAQHVKAHCPEVDHVFYDINGRWLYCDGLDPVDFPETGIDIGLLEDAADEVEVLPAAFFIGD